MDKVVYDDLVSKKLEEDKFHVTRKDPLSDSVKRVEKALVERKPIIKKVVEFRIPNPPLPIIKCLPKIHKEDNEVREIIVATNSPTQTIVKWFLEEVKRLSLKIGNVRFNKPGGYKVMKY